MVYCDLEGRMTTPPDPKKRFSSYELLHWQKTEMNGGHWGRICRRKVFPSARAREFMCGTNGFEPTFRGAVGISRNLVRRLFCSRLRPADEVPGDAASPPSCCRSIAVITSHDLSNSAVIPARPTPLRGYHMLGTLNPPLAKKSSD